ncbi:MAG: ribosome recycling factor [Planctomycetes bacterium]|nr:ribosome recycling factor [Planctomycetota bacterium]NUQ34314.1 ribosome recycling factor [Planctomycetaceae bacterium]
MGHTYDSVVKEFKAATTKAIDHLKNEFKSVRTGRAHPAMVENVQVEYYGSRQGLKNVANINAQDATTLTIKPFDPSQQHAIVKAIQEANLGFNPIDDGKMIRINMPPMTEENRKRIAGQLKDMAERSKVTVRNARQDANKHADLAHKDKAANMTEDSHRALKDEIQNITNSTNKQIDELLKTKTEEVMKI